MRKPGIHRANPATSKRLQRVIKALQAFPSGLTTRELVITADVCAVNSCISELRAGGIPVECENLGRSAAGSAVFRYRLT